MLLQIKIDCVVGSMVIMKNMILKNGVKKRDVQFFFATSLVYVGKTGLFEFVVLLNRYLTEH